MGSPPSSYLDPNRKVTMLKLITHLTEQPGSAGVSIQAGERLLNEAVKPGRSYRSFPNPAGGTTVAVWEGGEATDAQLLALINGG